MRRRAAAAGAVLLALSGCGIQRTDVVEAGGAATVIVQPVPEERMTLYFLGPDDRLMPMVRDLGRPGPVVSDPATTRPSASGPADDTVPYDGFGPGYEVSAGTLRREPVTVDKTLAALLAGPGPEEAAAGATTALPRGGTRAPRVETERSGPSAPALRIKAPFPVGNLPETAVRQLVCTAAYAHHPTGRAEVTVAGPDGTLPAARCED
ncbi:hypothetical protein ACFYNX_07710 [Streptomyces sp. NPDC007872]|uniref:hypothetical protein n=1 Tax=Streptomyces sp. NPDC007872 TaxID=3364782 RepID=UPI0036CF4302